MTLLYQTENQRDLALDPTNRYEVCEQQPKCVDEENTIFTLKQQISIRRNTKNFKVVRPLINW